MAKKTWFEWMLLANVEGSENISIVQFFDGKRSEVEAQIPPLIEATFPNIPLEKIRIGLIQMGDRKQVSLRFQLEKYFISLGFNSKKVAESCTELKETLLNAMGPPQQPPSLLKKFKSLLPKDWRRGSNPS